jgi:hypothetical protein
MTRNSNPKNRNDFPNPDANSAMRIAAEKQAKVRKRLNADTRLLQIKQGFDKIRIGRVLRRLIKSLKSPASNDGLRQA